MPIEPSSRLWKTISALYQIFVVTAEREIERGKSCSVPYRMLSIHAPFLLLAMLRRTPSLKPSSAPPSLIGMAGREPSRFTLPYFGPVSAHR